MAIEFYEHDRVTSLDPEDEGARGVVLETTPTGGVLVLWDEGHETWTTAGHLDYPEPSERDLERHYDAERNAELRQRHFGIGG